MYFLHFFNIKFILGKDESFEPSRDLLLAMFKLAIAI